MFCGNCGADIPAHLRFCTTCGAPTDNEETRVATEETRVAAPRAAESRTSLERADWPSSSPNLPQTVPRSALARTDDAAENVIFTVRPTFLFVGLGYALAALSAILLTVLLALYVRQMPVIYAVPFALLFLL